MTNTCPLGAPECARIAPQRITFDRKINLQGLVTALILFGSFLVFFARQEARLALLEQGLRNVIEKNREQDSEFRNTVKQIHEKLDRLIERQIEKKP